MSLRLSRANVALAGCLTVAFAIGIPIVRAQDRAQSDGTETRVEALAKMSQEARRAELKKMSAEERRSLWFELKRARAEADDRKPPTRNYGEALRSTTRASDRKAAAPKAGASQLDVGTIKYDDGVTTTTFGGGAIVGNRFDTATGEPVLQSGTVSTVVGVVHPGPAITTSSAGFVLLGPQTPNGGAFAIFSTFTGGLTAATETVTFSGLGVEYTGDSFFVLFGDFNASYVPAFGSGSTLDQGFHGVVGYTGGQGPNITSTFDFGGTLNGLVRVTGNVLPVELMSFEVE